tara:strand:+ start:787 stop:1983 length:1197 start_codon:yes stop_codon:yes gene_type:complete
MSKSQALSGMKVLDCSQILAGPFCTMMLADMGAEVIKIEKPNGGDDTRGWGPPFIAGESAAFLQLNRNKKSISLNIQTEKGKEIFLKLISESDVFVENFRPGSLKKLNLDYEDIKKVNPKIIHCSISGFGKTGPYSNRAGFDLVAQGMSGLMSITGTPDSPPVKVGVPISDLNGGVYAMYGILSAYIHLLKTGEGQYVESSLLESSLAYTVWESSIYFSTGEIPSPMGSAHRLSAPYQSVKTKDGYINIGAPNQSNWERLTMAIDREDLIKDAKFRGSPERLKNRVLLEKELEKSFTKKTTQDWMEILEKAGVPAGPIFNMKDVWNNEQVKSRNMDVLLDHPTAGTIHNIGIATKLSETPGVIHSPAPLLGQHTSEILKQLGYKKSEIEELKNNGTLK